MNLSKDIKIEKVRAYNNTGGTTNANGTDVDFSGYDGVLFFGWMEKATETTDTNQIKVEQKDSDGNYTALTGANAVCVEDDQVLAVDVYRPLESQGKVLRVVVDIATSTKYGDMYAIKYNGRVKPEDFADVTKLVISPEVAS